MACHGAWGHPNESRGNPTGIQPQLRREPAASTDAGRSGSFRAGEHASRPRHGARRPLALLGGPAPAATIPIARPLRPALDDVVERLRPSYDSGMLTNGPLVRELEARVAERLGVAHVVAVSSCTSGLTLVVQAAIEGRPGPVAMPSFTFSATAHAVAWNGREPRFVEMDPATFQVDPDDLAAALDGAAAVLVPHLYGAPCAPAQLEELAAAAGVPLIFDAAHALGATHRGRAIGGFGLAEIFSLTPTKVMVAGEGGLISTDDDELAARLRIGRSYADPGDYDTQFNGLNARMSELHAAVALESLLLLDESLAARRAVAARYRAGLDTVPGIAPQVVADGDVSSYKDFTLTVQPGAYGLTRDELVAVLASEGVDTRNYFDPPVHRQHAYRHVAVPPLPITEAIASSIVSLPIYPALEAAEQEHILEVIDEAHRHAEEVRAALASRHPSALDPHDRVGG